jgi:hypothetical protein
MKKFKKLMQLVGLACCMTTATVSAVQVTFQVNMSVQRDLGAFDPSNDYVYVAGNFNGWSTTASLLTQSPIDSDVWVGTFEVGAEGTWVNYKYVMNRLVGGVKWEDNVGPGGTQNRYFQVPASDAELDVVYFNNITNAAVPYAPVTFQVDRRLRSRQRHAPHRGRSHQQLGHNGSSDCPVTQPGGFKSLDHYPERNQSHWRLGCLQVHHGRCMGIDCQPHLYHD